MLLPDKLKGRISQETFHCNHVSHFSIRALLSPHRTFQGTLSLSCCCWHHRWPCYSRGPVNRSVVICRPSLVVLALCFMAITKILWLYVTKSTTDIIICTSQVPRPTLKWVGEPLHHLKVLGDHHRTLVHPCKTEHLQNGGPLHWHGLWPIESF